MSEGKFECDICGLEHSYDDIQYVTTRRPSDQTELVAVMWLCPTCRQLNPEMDAKSSTELGDYFDSGEAAKVGLIFLSI